MKKHAVNYLQITKKVVHKIQSKRMIALQNRSHRKFQTFKIDNKANKMFETKNYESHILSDTQKKLADFTFISLISV